MSGVSDKPRRKTIDEEIQNIEKMETSEVDGDTTETSSEGATDKRRRVSKRTWVVIAIVAALAITAFIVPFTRYALAGVVVKKRVELYVIDSGTKKPVSNAGIKLGRHDGRSDAIGKVVINDVPVGDYPLVIEKQHYRTRESTLRVPIIMNQSGTTQEIDATGRAVDIIVTNSISGDPVAGAVIENSDTTTTAGEDGKATVVVDARADSIDAAVSAAGYENQDVTHDMKDSSVAWQITLTPSGKVAFLSKRTGRLDVMTSSLDGAKQQVIVEGTGKEGDDTILIPSPSWKQAALIAQRDDRAKLYMVSIQDGQLHAIDDTEAAFMPIGWVNGYFYYRMQRNSMAWQPKAEAIVAYNVENGTRTVIDETNAMGTNYYDYAGQLLAQPRVVGSQLIYTKSWSYGPNQADRSRPFVIAAIDGTSKKTLTEITSDTGMYGEVAVTKPLEALISANKDGVYSFYRIVAGKASPVEMSMSEFTNSNRVFMASPDGKRVFWSDERDGKNVSFMASSQMESQSQLANNEYKAFGWFTNEYILYSKNSSELFIAPAGKAFNGEHKITDYHRARYYFGGGVLF